jgi:hypothetical protein
MRELSLPGTVQPDALSAAEEAVVHSKLVHTIIKKQKDTGTWGGNLMALAPSAKDGLKDVGTIPNYRRLVQLGYPQMGRPFKLADRLLFRLLSRDDDPSLQFEFAKYAKELPPADSALVLLDDLLADPAVDAALKKQASELRKRIARRKK